jgi:HAD superfamily hydrolase (TIGR01509 family)
MVVKIVVFDLGGVVVRICRSLKEAGERCGIEVREEDITAERRAERRAIHAEYERGRMGCEEFFVAIAKTTGGKYTPEQFRTMHMSWIIEEYAGVAELIDDLHAAGIATGVLSNTNASHWGQMQGVAGVSAAKFPATTKPQHRHASHLLGVAKPEVGIYREFEKRVGFMPREIVFFDDLPENIRAAHAAGWGGHVIDHMGDTAGQMRSWLRGQGIL